MGAIYIINEMTDYISILQNWHTIRQPTVVLEIKFIFLLVDLNSDLIDQFEYGQDY